VTISENKPEQQFSYEESIEFEEKVIKKPINLIECPNCSKKIRDNCFEKHVRLCKYANNFTKNKKNDFEDIEENINITKIDKTSNIQNKFDSREKEKESNPKNNKIDKILPEQNLIDDLPILYKNKHN